MAQQDQLPQFEDVAGHNNQMAARTGAGRGCVDVVGSVTCTAPKEEYQGGKESRRCGWSYMCSQKGNEE